MEVTKQEVRSKAKKVGSKTKETSKKEAKTLIDFRKIIDELSDDAFQKLKALTREFVPFYFMKEEEADKFIYLEKIGEYLKNFEKQNHKIRDNDFALMYVKELSSLMKNRAKSATRVEDYCQRSAQIEKEIPSANADELLSLLEDETKLFVCFYNSFLDNGVPVSDAFFFANEVDLNGIKAKFLVDKPEPGKDKKAFRQRMDNVVPRQIKDLGVKVNSLQEEIASKLAKKPDSIKEPIHDVIEFEEVFERYTVRSACFVLMALLYSRVTDFETGRMD